MKTAAEIIKENDRQVIKGSRETTIEDAINMMGAGKVGSIMVMDGTKVVGMWTERDLLRSVLNDNFDVKSATLGDYMSTTIYTASGSDNIYMLMDKFLGLRIRHLFIMDGDKLLGLLSSGDVMKYSLRDKYQELMKENHKVSWNYYEEWKWDSSK
jgi:CBS domain-containing protein